MQSGTVGHAPDSNSMYDLVEKTGDVPVTTDAAGVVFPRGIAVPRDAALVQTDVVRVAVLGALACLFGAGRSVDVMTPAGLALAVGPMVDSTIICLENAHRHSGLGPGRGRPPTWGPARSPCRRWWPASAPCSCCSPWP